jgi:hypothetical protein
MPTFTIEVDCCGQCPWADHENETCLEVIILATDSGVNGAYELEELLQKAGKVYSQNCRGLCASCPGLSA